MIMSSGFFHRIKNYTIRIKTHAVSVFPKRSTIGTLIGQGDNRYTAVTESNETAP